MLIISFAWTVDALLAGRKSVTRRDWPDDYARRFKVGSTVQAYDKSARCGGKCRAIVRVEDVRREPLARLVDDQAYGRAELVREGDLWTNVDTFLTLFGKLTHGDPFRIQFSLVEIAGKQASLPLVDLLPDVHAKFCLQTRQSLKSSLCQAYWKELLQVHGFTPVDVSLTALYLQRQVEQGKRQEGCLKIFNFANPVQFDADLALARRSRFQTKRESPPPANLAPTETPAKDEEFERARVAARREIDKFRASIGRRAL